MKKIFIAISLLCCLVMFTGYTNYKLNNNKKTVTIVSNFVREDGKREINFSDGSWAIYKESEGIFEFQPISMGDWSYTLKDKEELKKCIENYLYINN